MYEEWAWIACVLFALWLFEQSCGCTTWSFGLKRSTSIKKSCCGVLLPPLVKSAYSRETQLLIPLLVPRWPASTHGLFFLSQQKTGSAAGIRCLFNILLHPALSAKAIVARFFFPLAFDWFNHKVGQSYLNGACFCSVLHCFVDFGARLQ